MRALKILCLSRYDAAGPSSRYRMYQFFPALRAAGHQVVEAPLLGQGYVENLYAGRRTTLGWLAAALGRRLRHLSRVRHYDVVWMEKELLPFVPGILELVLELAGVRVVVDYDDAIFHQYDQHRSALVRWLLGRKIDRVMASASLVVAGNGYLAARARAAGAARVEVIPTVVDLERYAVPRPTGSHRLTVGWIGSPKTQSYLGEIAPALRTFCAERGARVVAIGAAPDFALPGVPLEVVPWSEAGEVASLMDLDIGVMPLRDSPWERGKCGFKLVQYMACALPVIASPVGVNQEIVVVGETGFLAESPEEWLGALQALAASAELRERMGRAGRLRVERNYSLTAAAPRVIEALTGPRR